MSIDISKPLYKATYYVHERKNFHIYLFPEIPYWFIGGAKIKTLLDLVDGRNSFKDIKNIVKIDNKTTDFMNFLFKINILSYSNINESKKLPETFKLQNVIIAVTNECNLRCKSCFNKSGKSYENEFTRNDISKALDEMKPFIGDNGFTLTGGEPFIKPEIVFEILEKAYEWNSPIGIVSNGILINSKIAQNLSKYDNLTVQISLDGAYKEAHEWNRGKNTFEPTLNAIKILKENNIKVLISYLLTSESINDIDNMINLAEEINVNWLRFIEMFWGPFARDETLKKIPAHTISYDICKAISQKPSREKLLELDTGSMMRKNLKLLKSKKYCGAGKTSLFIDSRGNVFPCSLITSNEFKLGNIKYDKFETIMASKVRKNLSSISVDKIEKCKNCDIKYFCAGGCRAVAYKENKDIYNSVGSDCAIRKEAIYTYLEQIAQYTF